MFPMKMKRKSQIVAHSSQAQKKYKDEQLESRQPESTLKSQIPWNIVLSGSVQKVLKWHKTLNDNRIFYELFGSIEFMREGAIRCQQIIGIRSRTGTGPVIQLIAYRSDRIEIHDFHIGIEIRCVGNMMGPNMLRVISVRNASDTEIRESRRLDAICERSFQHLIKQT